MRARNYSFLLLFILAVMICFIAAPVFSGNGSSDGHPWDADDTGSDDLVDGPDNPDTTTTTAKSIVLKNNPLPNPNDTDFLDGFSSFFVYFVMSTAYYYQPVTFVVFTETQRSVSKQEVEQPGSAK